MGPRSLVECIEVGAAHADPDKPAVVGVDGSLSYGELLRGARGIAGRLAEAGVGAGCRVGVWMEKTPACVQAILGVLFSGAAYVPLDPLSPWPRCRAIARDCGLSALLADEPRADLLGPLLEGLAPRLVLLHGVPPERATAVGHPTGLLSEAAAGPPAPPARPDPDHLAYVLYTSGSTGAPKGVAHTHGSGLAFAQWVQERFGIRPEDVFSSHAPFHFDLSISDLFASMGAGASVRVLSAAQAMVAPYLARMLDPWGITVWYSVPSILVSMLASGNLEACPPRRLRLLFFAGEVFPAPQLLRLRRALPGVRLVNLFGPTETNVCTYYEVPAGLADDRTPIPIGARCEHMETFILGDDGLEVTAPGVEGTLWVKGGNLMREYWNDPARTAQVLQPDPRGRPGVACCTGDRVRLLPDGNYEFRGRRDHMVKTRGYRVELGEIEAILAAHPDVREAVAIPLPDRVVGNRIVASVVPRAGARIDLRALRTYLRRQLPNYMVPGGIDVRAELPRTSTGKADRTLLRTEWEGRGEA
jgi:L-proline---[L-prolyl-carrier protein] ligase